MPVSAVIFIEKLRVNAVQLPHAKGKIPVRGFDKEVVMIGHETVSMADPVISLDDVLKCIEKCFPVMVIFKNRLLFVTTGSHMVDSSRVFYAKRARHMSTIAEIIDLCNKRDLTLETLTLETLETTRD